MTNRHLKESFEDVNISELEQSIEMLIHKIKNTDRAEKDYQQMVHNLGSESLLYKLATGTFYRTKKYE